MAERDWSGALSTAFQRHLEVGGSGGSSGSGRQNARQSKALRAAPLGTTAREGVVPVVPDTSKPTIADGVGTTGTTTARTVVPAKPERTGKQPQRVAGSGTTGTTGTTELVVVRAEQAEPSFAPVMDAEDWQAAYDERSAVREFDGGLPRAEAERLAYADTVADLGEPPPGVQLSPPSATILPFTVAGRQR
jgi:hypothetical protein